MSIQCPFWKEDICGVWDNKPSGLAVTLPLAVFYRDVTRPPARLIQVGTGGNKLAMSDRVDNFPAWKLKYELKKTVICPPHRRKFRAACLRDQSGPSNIFNSFHSFMDRCSIICIHIWTKYLLPKDCLPTHNSIANNLKQGYIGKVGHVFSFNSDLPLVQGSLLHHHLHTHLNKISPTEKLSTHPQFNC